jgi:hypothetical protein
MVHTTRCKLERLVAKEAELKADMEDKAKAQQEAVSRFQQVLDAHQSGKGKESASVPGAASAAAPASGGVVPDMHPALKALRDENAELKTALAQALAAIAKIGAAANGAVEVATPQAGTLQLPELFKQQAAQAAAAAAVSAGQTAPGANSSEPRGLPPDGAAGGRVRARDRKKENEDDMVSASEGEDARSRSDKGSRRVRPRPDPNAEADASQHGQEGYQETLARAAKVQESIDEALRASGRSSG